jgi:flagellar biosynthetic protein FliQ
MEIARQALIVFFKIAAPVMLISLAVGFIISLFQALTQIQEQTLTFVPKIFVIFLSLIFLMPFMLGTLRDFHNELDKRIINIGQGENSE